MMITRRKIVGTLTAGLVAPSLAACATAATLPSGVLQQAMASKAVPGMTAIVIRDFKVESELVAGISRLGDPAPVTPGARWHVGSNGKALTATLIARLVEAKLLAWNAPLSQMLPELAAGMQPAYRDATLPDLLSHHAGLPENTSDLDFFARFQADPAPLPLQRLRYISSCLAEAPVAALRTAPQYSNTGLITAAACAERATGETFESLIDSEVFAPLGMRSVSFDQYGGPGEPAGHVDGRIANHPQDANPRMFAPAGAMRFTMQDWARFCIDQMHGEHGRGKLLSTETYRFLHTAQGGDVEGAGWALGWGAAPHPMNLEGPALTHSGSDGNWFALVCLFPQTGNGVLVVSNAADSMGGDQSTLEAMRALAATIASPLTAPAS